jgi:hypothetical protein
VDFATLHPLAGNLTSKLVRFAFVDDNAVDLTVIDRKSPDLPDD